MNNKKIVVDISETGNVSIEGNNFVGPECDHFIKEIADSIGKTVSSTKKKEFNIKIITKQKEKN